DRIGHGWMKWARVVGVVRFMRLYIPATRLSPRILVHFFECLVHDVVIVGGNKNRQRKFREDPVRIARFVEVRRGFFAESRNQLAFRKRTVELYRDEPAYAGEVVRTLGQGELIFLCPF